MLPGGIPGKAGDEFAISPGPWGRMRLSAEKEERFMRKLLAVSLCFWPALAPAQTADELLNDGRNPENITTFGLGYDLKMYSPLAQIDRSNVRRLVPVWAFSLANDVGEHSQPTIYN